MCCCGPRCVAVGMRSGRSVRSHTIQRIPRNLHGPDAGRRSCRTPAAPMTEAGVDFPCCSSGRVTSSPNPRRTPMADFAALVFAVLSILVFIGSAIWFWVQAPDTVASHFDASGQPDDWSSKANTLGLLVPIGVGIPALFSIRWIWEKLPSSIVNIPFKDYWLNSGERASLYDCLMQFMRFTGGALALLLTSVLVMIMREGRGATMPTGMTFLPTGVFLIITAAALINLVRRLRPPR